MLEFRRLLLLVSLGTSIRASAGDVRDHAFMKQIDQGFDALEKAAFGIACLSPVAGFAAGKVSDHYRGLTEAVASCVVASGDLRDVGSGANGYQGMAVLADAPTLQQLAEQAPAAYAWFSAQSERAKVSWEEWKARFKNETYPEGDARVALAAFLAVERWNRDGWYTAHQLADGKLDPVSKPSFDLLEKSVAGAPDTGSYQAGAFAPSAFGLELPARKESDPPRFWGKSYKVMAGATLAAALTLYGYSAWDVRFAVSRANIAYETTDFLNDHLGKTSEDVAQVPDSTQEELQPAFERFRKALAERLKTDGALVKTLIGQVFNAPHVASLLAPAFVVNAADASRLLSDERALVAALITLRSYDPETFEKKVEPVLAGVTPQEHAVALSRLFAASAADVKWMDSGAAFAVEKLASYPKNPKRWKGVLPYLEAGDRLCESARGAVLAPFRKKQRP